MEDFSAAIERMINQARGRACLTEGTAYAKAMLLHISLWWRGSGQGRGRLAGSWGGAYSGESRDIFKKGQIWSMQVVSSGPTVERNSIYLTNVC